MGSRKASTSLYQLAKSAREYLSAELGVTGLKRFMLEQLGAADGEELDLKLRMVSEAGEHLIAYAYEQPRRDARDRVITGMKRMLASYLFPARD